MASAPSHKRAATGARPRACLLALFCLYANLAYAIPPPRERDCAYLEQAVPAPDAAEGGIAALQGLLAQPQPDAECLAKLLAKGESGSGVKALASLMLTDRQAAVRRNAALVLGEWNSGPLAVFEALSNGLRSEPDHSVALARIGSAGRLMRYARTTPWNEKTSIRMVVDAVSQYWPATVPADGMATIDWQRILALRNIADGLQLQQAGDADDAPALRQARRDPALVGAMVDAILRSLGGLSVDGRVAALQLLADLAAGGRFVAIGAETPAAAMRAMLPLLSDPAPGVRAGAAGVISRVLLAQAPHNDPAWRDFSPALRADLVDALSAALGAALGDAEPAVRREAAAGLGALMAFRPRHIDALVALLADGDAGVRASAARALARLPALPAPALIPLQAMARAGNSDAEGAILALSNHPSQEVAATLVAVLALPPGPPRLAAMFPEPGAYVPPDLGPTAHRALRKLGAVAARPLLAHVAATITTESRDSLFATLEAIGWREAMTDTSQVVAALMPGLSSADEEARVMALALLAMWRPYAGLPYPDALAELATRDYLSLSQRDAARNPAHPNLMVFIQGWPNTETRNHDWAQDPQLSVAAIAGNSRSPVAAQRLVDWICLATPPAKSFDGEDIPDVLLETIGHSLGAMGSPAAGPVLDALTRGAGGKCRETLFGALAEMDLDGTDEAAIAGMSDALKRELSGLRPGLLALEGESLQSNIEALREALVTLGRTHPQQDIATHLATLQRAGALGSAARFAVPDLVRVMQGSPAQLREAAATSLGLIGAPEALPALLAAAQAHPGTPLARRAQLASRRIRQAAGNPKRGSWTPPP